MTTGLLGARALLAYGLLGLPLAFAALPIYVHVPKLYADSLGLSLSVVGAVLLFARLGDALIDPLLGVWSDRLGKRKLLIALAAPIMMLGMWGLLNPEPARWSSPTDGPLWLAATLAAVYLGYSIATINYYAWGAEMSSLPHERTRITATREGCALIGVIAAAALPGVLAADLPTGLAALSLIFCATLAIACAITLGLAPASPPASGEHPGMLEMLRGPLRNHRFVALLLVFAVNGIASAIPATLVLFFIKDVLQLEASAGLFLVLYFVGGVLALPLWVKLSRAYGKPQAWCVAMLLAILVFAWAGTLGPGDFMQFAAICALSGVALGADLALPPSILADIVDGGDNAGRGTQTGAYFGLWNFITKLNLALAAGLTMPALQWGGYVPGASGAEGTRALIIAYALAPLILKLAAAGLIWRQRRVFII